MKKNLEPSQLLNVKQTILGENTYNKHVTKNLLVYRSKRNPCLCILRDTYMNVTVTLF